MAKNEIEPLVTLIPKALTELTASHGARTAVRTKALAEHIILHHGYSGEVYDVAKKISAFAFMDTPKDPSPLKGYFRYVGGWNPPYTWNNFEWAHP